MTLLKKLGVADAALPKFKCMFWAKLSLHKEVLTLLTKEYGVRVNLQMLRSFWTTLEDQAAVNALRADLATLR